MYRKPDMATPRQYFTTKRRSIKAHLKRVCSDLDKVRLMNEISIDEKRKIALVIQDITSITDTFKQSAPAAFERWTGLQLNGRIKKVK